MTERRLARILAPHEDAFGAILADHLAGKSPIEVIERDDGFVFTGDPAYWLAPRRVWWPQERRAMRLVRGRVLDVGCGGGRIGLDLQEHGFEVTGLDLSPGALAIARERGMRDARAGSVADAIRHGERFDTILLLGNNVGLLSGAAAGPRYLRELAHVAAAGARLLAGSYDPYDGASESARRYQEHNRARGRMGGVERLRVRYRDLATPWYDVLFASREELAALADGTGWVLRRFIDEGAGYVAVLERG